MTMPINLLLVRHGESEGNIANYLSKQGSDELFTPEFINRHSSSWRLTDKGIQQAKNAGQWIKNNITANFHRYYVSEYARAKETAALLGFPDAQWYVEFHLRERDWGILETISHQERMRQFKSVLNRKEIDGIYWKPPNGESMADVCLRIDRVIATLHRECSEANVIIVCHGEVMWAFLLRLLRLSTRQYAELDRSKDPIDRIHNCQILHFTRANPTNNNEIDKYLMWWRSICPWDEKRSHKHWIEISRSRYSNEELLAEVDMIPRMLS